MKSRVYGCSRAAGAAAVVVVAANAVAGVPDPRINEVRVGQTGADTNEYIELAGTPGSLTGLYYIVLGDDGGSDGTVEEVVNYLGQSIQPSGFHLTVDQDWPPPPPATANSQRPLNFLGGNRTHLLVENFMGQVGDDLDTDDDGILDIIPWSGIIDCVAVVGPGTPIVPFVPLGIPLSCFPEVLFPPTWIVPPGFLPVPVNAQGEGSAIFGIIPPPGVDIYFQAYNWDPVSATVRLSTPITVE